METDNSSGISLDFADAWELEPIRRIYLTDLLSNLPVLFDNACTIALASIEADAVKEFVAAHEPKNRPDIYGCAGGDEYLVFSFIPPTMERKRHSRALHMRLTQENLAGLVDLSRHHAAPEVCMHIFVYRDDRVLMECSDAGCSDPQPMIHRSVSEDRVKAFSEAVGFRYQKYVVEE